MPNRGESGIVKWGVCHVSEQRDVLKRFSLAFLLSLLSCLFCLDSLFWHGLATLNLVISTQHHYSAQIDFDMHEFKLFLFSHAWRYHHVFGIKWKKMPLIMKQIVWLNLAWQWRYPTDKTGFLFIGTHCIGLRFTVHGIAVFVPMNVLMPLKHRK